MSKKSKARTQRSQPERPADPPLEGASGNLPLPAADRGAAHRILPLRLFLGATFVYAGLQKISDPGFLQPGSATYLGTQLQGFAGQSPIGFLIDIFALPTPQLTGIGVIAAELAIGALVLAGIATRWAAVAGGGGHVVFLLT